MKKLYFIALTCLLFLNATAQNISFRSNGRINNFTKIDTLSLTVYDKSNLKISAVAFDSIYQTHHLKLDNNSIGVISRNKDEVKRFSKNLIKSNNKFFTTFYAYSDGVLEAPTPTIFFKPKGEMNVSAIFGKLGTVQEHPKFKGYYYLQLNTNTYNIGDQIFNLCDSLYNCGIATDIEPVFVRLIKASSDPYLPQEWHIQNTGNPGADMAINGPWSLGYNGTGIKVAVIDCGVDLTHPDLQSNLLSGYDATGGGTAGGAKLDNNNTHGTSVAGIIGEIENNIGAVGVANGAKIIPVRVGIITVQGSVEYFSASDNNITNSLTWATDHGADILNNSYGGGSPSTQINNAINYAKTNGRNGLGSIVVFSSGNKDTAFVIYPGSNSNVIAVGASTPCDTRKSKTSCDGEFWWGSSYGTNLDVIAPGVDIYTTNFNVTGTTLSHGYMSDFNGTSSAAPNTSAVLALILDANPSLTGQQARTILETTTDKVGGYNYSQDVIGQPNGSWSSEAGYGRINAFGAVMKALGHDIIAGPGNICAPGVATYSFPYLPAGATIIWSTDLYSSGGSIVPSGNDVVVTTNTTAFSDFNLTATVTLNGATFSASRRLTVGNLFEGTYDYNGIHDVQVIPPNFLPAGVYTHIDYTWHGVHSITGTVDQPVNVSFSTNTIYVGMPSANSSISSFTVTMRGTDSCGSEVSLPLFFVKSSCCGLTATTNNYILSPNPAATTITIQPNSISTPTPQNKQLLSSVVTGIKEVTIYNQSGQLKSRQVFNGQTMRVQLDLSTLPNGIYYVKILSGSNTIEQKVLRIQR